MTRDDEVLNSEFDVSFIQQLFLKSDNCTFAHAGQVAVNKRLSHFWGSQPKLKYSSV